VYFPGFKACRTQRYGSIGGHLKNLKKTEIKFLITKKSFMSFANIKKEGSVG
jgi:hypothetical protein